MILYIIPFYGTRNVEKIKISHAIHSCIGSDKEIADIVSKYWDGTAKKFSSSREAIQALRRRTKKFKIISKHYKDACRPYTYCNCHAYYVTYIIEVEF